LREWLARYSDIYDRPIIPIDLRRDDWVVAYNLLRERRAAASVITANMVDALAYVWGGWQHGCHAAVCPYRNHALSGAV
jgi:hypothetical protein